MTSIPANLVEAFGNIDREAINTWWTTLSNDAQSEVKRLCDDRLDACFFGVVADDGEHVVPKVNGGKFLADDDSWGIDEWGPSYFEHLLQHPELVLVFDPTQRTFHTGCVRHGDAQACWKHGAVPEGFACPFRDHNCLMKPFVGKKIGFLR